MRLDSIRREQKRAVNRRAAFIGIALGFAISIYTYSPWSAITKGDTKPQPNKSADPLKTPPSK